MLNNDVRKGYNKVADQYLKQRNQFENNKYLDKLIEILAKGSLILDIGCGAGMPIDLYLINKGYRVIGIDISERQIELAKQNVPQGEFKLKDMSLLVNKEYSVDAIVSFYAIFHTPREKHLDLLKKMYSFIRENGFLLITMGADNWVGTESNFYGGKMSWSHYDAEMNKKLIIQAGFQILFDEIDTSGDEKHLIVLAKK